MISLLTASAQLNSNKYGVTVTSEPASEDERIFFTLFKKKVGLRRILRFSYTIKVHFNSRYAGFYDHLLVFKFETHQPSSEKFEIMRLLEVQRLTSISVEPAPTTAKKSSGDHNHPSCYTFLSSKVEAHLQIVLYLKTYAMPRGLKDFKISERYVFLKDGLNVYRQSIKTPLNWKNYARRFHLLLHLEEHQQQSEKEVRMKLINTMEKNLLCFQILRVSKKSTFKLPGCQVHVTLLHQAGFFHEKCYRGWVHHVDAEKVYIKLRAELEYFKDGLKVRVKFLINRITLRIEHRAAALVHRNRLREVLFPTVLLYSMNKGNNPEQCTAVQHIVANTAKPAPYLVFGPPGTGKTVTLVKAIMQIVKTKPAECNILVCAPSNSATDHLCEKILEVTPKRCTVYRLYALRCFSCNLDLKENQVMIPSKVELMRHKIMVTTLNTAGRLVTGGIPQGHYSYIFVDEAGQATEPECIIPLAGLMKLKTCQVVLAGDPKQLGAVITSIMAKKYGLGLSLLERLMSDIDLYKQHETYGFNKRFVTKLLRNYRSHPAILKIPNGLFYKGELQTFASNEICSLYCKWELLPKKGFPLIFHGVAGTDERDEDSPSIYNTAEVEVLKEYLKALIKHLHKKGVTNIGPNEIGIIAPYRKQVRNDRHSWIGDRPVGTVESFQGKESKVILVSAARSIPKLTDPKQRFSLGFVDNEKRFNVAMTRAQALLIVVGDPRVLRTDATWNKFIHYCYEEGGYRGIPLSDEEEEDTLTDENSPSFR
uniref:RNA helicase n=1 Tax=Labrus bergylta TaxID=56723 RepID=A0A3Q3EYN8_9LABR